WARRSPCRLSDGWQTGIGRSRARTHPFRRCTARSIDMSILSPSQNVLRNAPFLQASVRVLSSNEAEAIRSEVIRKFALRRGRPLWENLANSASLQDPDGWRLIDSYLSGNPFILFFDEEEDKQMIEFPAQSRLVPILEECPGFEFYLTDRETTYLL